MCISDAQTVEPKRTMNLSKQSWDISQRLIKSYLPARGKMHSCFRTSEKRVRVDMWANI